MAEDFGEAVDALLDKDREDVVDAKERKKKEHMGRPMVLADGMCVSWQIQLEEPCLLPSHAITQV